MRYLHKLFQCEGITVGRWIQRQRLAMCRRDLARPTARPVTVAAVAGRWGFVSASHFSRSFRTAYGVSPRSGRPVPASPRHPPWRPASRHRAGRTWARPRA
ncbi:helix-turn-helix transcriptional regulator [Kitasatospora aburaviensis]